MEGVKLALMIEFLEKQIWFFKLINFETHNLFEIVKLLHLDLVECG